MSVTGRIIYNSINVDFVRRWNSFVDENINRVDTLTAGSGIEEDLEYFDLDVINAFRKSLEAQEKIELKQWYEFAKGGASFELLRDRDLGTMIAFEGKSLNDINEVGATFTRTTATDADYYTDPFTGLLTNISTTNIARFPAGKFGSAFLVEGVRTNLCTNPSDLGTNFVNVGAVNTISLNTLETKDPTGANLADKITFGASPNPIRFSTSTAISTDDGVYSILAKSPSGSSTITLVLLDDTGAQLATSGSLTVTPNGSPDVGNGFQKFDVAFENGGTNANNWRFEISGTEGDIVYVCGNQLEVGAEVLFPSRTIGFASSSSVTRNADLFLKPTVNVMDKNQGTIGFWFNPPYIHTDSPDAFFFEVDDINGTSTLAIRLLANGNYNIFRRINNSSTLLFNDTSAANGSGITKNSWNNHIVLTWDQTASSHKLYFNGVKLTTYTHDAGNYSDLSTNFSIGSGITGNLPSFCAFDDFFIRKDVLNASQILNIFGRGIGLAEQRNRWPAVKLIDRTFNPIRQVGWNRYNFALTVKEVIS